MTIKFVIVVHRLENDMGPTTVVSLAFVLTDGQTKHKMKLSEEAQRLHQLNVTVYSIGVGPECQAVSPQSSCVNTTELEIISGSENRTHHVDQFGELQDIMEVRKRRGLNALPEEIRITPCLSGR